MKVWFLVAYCCVRLLFIFYIFILFFLPYRFFAYISYLLVLCFYGIPIRANEWVTVSISVPFALDSFYCHVLLLYVFICFILSYYYHLEVCLFFNEP